MSLENLAKLFGEDRLYIVGGYVRNMLMDVPASDIDIASPKRADEVLELLSNSEFRVEPSSLRMGTLIIRDGDEKYEYTAFRQDSYPEGSGRHRPLSVTFGRDMESDARRRDFTVNAIYYDVLADAYVDVVGGIEDVERGILRTVREPEEVFSEDGLRIMRLARFHAETGFSVEEKTFAAAKKLSYLINDISVERITEELKKILIADIKPYGNKGGHIQGIKMLFELGVLDRILPELTKGSGVAQNEKYHKSDVLTHSIDTMGYADFDIRLPALLHDVGKPYALERDGNMYAHAVIGSDIVRKIAARLRLSKRESAEAVKLTKIHMFDLDGKAKDRTVKKFILENADVIEKFFKLRKADIQASKQVDLTSLYKMENIYDAMMSKGTPLCIGELYIDGNDLMERGIVGKEIGTTLSELLEKAALGEVENSNLALVGCVLDSFGKKKNKRKV